MAANLQSGRLASLGKQFVRQIRSRDSAIIPSFSLRKWVHVSAYDKNLEEHVVHASVVPDDIIPPQRGQYWGPHPQTGVFGPATDHKPAAAALSATSAGSVLEQKAFFRSLEVEDLDKPIQH